jgi:benzodiazapine receptor
MKTAVDISASEPLSPLPRSRQVLALAGFVAVTFAAAAVGSYFTSTSVSGWYQQLARPEWRPPDWVFGPVWTTLYVMMSIAAWLVWRRGRWSSARIPLTLWGLQLLLNVGWSAFFFAMRQPGLAFYEIVLLWIAIAATIVAFWRWSKLAAILLVPYLAWVSFASVLNYAIWQMNS